MSRGEVRTAPFIPEEGSSLCRVPRFKPTSESDILPVHWFNLWGLLLSIISVDSNSDDQTSE